MDGKNNNAKLLCPTGYFSDTRTFLLREYEYSLNSLKIQILILLEERFSRKADKEKKFSSRFFKGHEKTFKDACIATFIIGQTSNAVGMNNHARPF